VSATASAPPPRRPLPVAARILLAVGLAAALVASTILLVGQVLPGGETVKIVLAFVWLGGLGFGIGKLVKGRPDLRIATRTAVVVAAGGIGAWWALSLRDTTVDEALVQARAAQAPAAPAAGPAAAAKPAPAAPKPAAPAGPRLLSAGAFRSLEHESSGRAEVVRLSGGASVLQFRDLATDPGPDLRVYLATDESASKHLDLGGLKANNGNQRYSIPAGASTGKYDVALIWCRSFSVGFAAADLEPARPA
jgi:Electron transfer DM13